MSVIISITSIPIKNAKVCIEMRLIIVLYKVAFDDVACIKHVLVKFSGQNVKALFNIINNVYIHDAVKTLFCSLSSYLT